MSTTEIHRSCWFLPLFCLLVGAVMLVAFAIGGDVIQGVFSFGIMAALAGVFAIARHSETVQGIGGPGRDEGWDMIDLRATAFRRRRHDRRRALWLRDPSRAAPTPARTCWSRPSAAWPTCSPSSGCDASGARNAEGPAGAGPSSSPSRV